MRARGAPFLAFVAGCYAAPAGEPCSITCTTDCPGDLTCSNGFCVGEGEVCAPQFAQVSTGGGFACAIDTNESLFCWGSNEHHQIAETDELAFPLAERIGGERWQMISAGRGHACGISDGRLFCWGANETGQISPIPGDVARPTEILITAGPQTWTAVFAGWGSTCAIGDGQLFCWGENSAGEAGIGNSTDTPSPTPVVSELRDWTAVAHGRNESYGHTCAISASTGLWCWGGNGNAQLGNGLADGGSSIPVNVLEGATSVAASAYSTCATTAAGELFCWGFAGYGALGDPLSIAPDNVNISTPTLGSTATGWTAVSANQWTTCGVRDGELYCWGRPAGVIGFGDGVFVPSGNTGTPAFIGPIASGVTAISIGPNERLDPVTAVVANADLETTCFLSNGAVRCWGDNRFGQLAQGATTLAPRPVEIAGARRWTQLATGSAHACGIDDAGVVACWGLALFGALDGIAGGSPEAPCTTSPCDRGAPKDVRPGRGLAIGAHHTCALDGMEVTCWGDNSWSQLGPTAPAPAPTVIPGLWSDLFDIHGNGACGRIGGETRCWGQSLDTFGEPTAFPELATMTQIEVGGDAYPGFRGLGCYLGTGGTLHCWGDNSLGQYGNGPPASLATCSNAVCEADECTLCPQDCPTECPTCGNGACDFAETASSCSMDCGNGTVASPLARTYTALGVGWALDNAGVLACGVKLDGTVECWGKNRGNVLGGLSDDIEYEPVAIPGLVTCSDVAVGDRHACAMCGQGTTILCWGDNSDGALGIGGLDSNTAPPSFAIDVVLETGDRWAQLTAGFGYTCARTEQGRGYCWGSSRHGALGSGGVASTIPVVVRAK